MLSERTVRKYSPQQIEPKPRKKYPPRQYGKLEQLQLVVKGRFYIGKQKLYPIGIIDWLDTNGIQHRYIKKRSPWQNGYIESYFKTLQTELLQENYFVTIDEASRKMKQF